MKHTHVLLAILLATGLAVLSVTCGERTPAAPAPSASAATSAPAPAVAPATNLSFAALARTLVRMPPEFPDELKQLEGRRVRIAGFVMPYDDPEKLQKILLVETPGGCFYCNPPNANAVVLVRRDPRDGQLAYDMDPVAFEGTLHLWHEGLKRGDEARQFLFTVDDARVCRGQRVRLLLQ